MLILHNIWYTDSWLMNAMRDWEIAMFSAYENIFDVSGFLI